jgi:hypothetical protein
VDVSRTIQCASFWEALVLGLMLEEHGVQVRRPEEGAGLSMVASGTLDRIKAAVAQLRHEFPSSGPVTIEGEARDEGAGTAQPAPSRDHIAPVVGPLPTTRVSSAPLEAQERVDPDQSLGAQERVDPDQPLEAQERVDPDQPLGAQERVDPDQPLEAQERVDPDQPLDGEAVIVPGEARYHRSGCELIRLFGSDDLETTTRQKAESDGYVPCRACKPDKTLSAQT